MCPLLHRAANKSFTSTYVGRLGPVAQRFKPRSPTANSLVIWLFADRLTSWMIALGFLMDRLKRIFGALLRCWTSLLD